MFIRIFVGILFSCELCAMRPQVPVPILIGNAAGQARQAQAPVQARAQFVVPQAMAPQPRLFVQPDNDTLTRITDFHKKLAELKRGYFLRDHVEDWMLTERSNENKTLVFHAAESWVEHSVSDNSWRRLEIFKTILRQGLGNQHFIAQLPELKPFLVDRRLAYRPLCQAFEEVFPGRLQELVGVQQPARIQAPTQERETCGTICKAFLSLENGKIHLIDTMELLEREPWLYQAVDDDNNDILRAVISVNRYRNERDPGLEELFAYLLYNGANPERQRVDNFFYQKVSDILDQGAFYRLQDGDRGSLRGFKNILDDFRQGRERLVEQFPIVTKRFLAAQEENDQPSAERIGKAYQLQDLINKLHEIDDSAQSFKNRVSNNPWMLTMRSGAGKTLICHVAEAWFDKRNLHINNYYYSYYYYSSSAQRLAGFFRWLLRKGRGNAEFEEELSDLMAYLGAYRRECDSLIDVFNEEYPGKFVHYVEHGSQAAEADNGDQLVVPIEEDEYDQLEQQEAQRHAHEQQVQERQRKAQIIAETFLALEVREEQLAEAFSLIQENPWVVHACSHEGITLLYKVVERYSAYNRHAIVGELQESLLRESLKELFGYLLYNGADPDTVKRHPLYNNTLETVSARLEPRAEHDCAELREILIRFRADRESLLEYFPNRELPAIAEPAIAGPVIVEEPVGGQNGNDQVRQGQGNQPQGAQQQAQKKTSFWSTWAGRGVVLGSSLAFGALVHYIYDKKIKKPAVGKEQAAIKRH